MRFLRQLTWGIRIKVVHELLAGGLEGGRVFGSHSIYLGRVLVVIIGNETWLLWSLLRGTGVAWLLFVAILGLASYKTNET
jgi:hypothetical protein